MGVALPQLMPSQVGSMAAITVTTQVEGGRQDMKLWQIQIYHEVR